MDREEKKEEDRWQAGKSGYNDSSGNGEVEKNWKNIPEEPGIGEGCIKESRIGKSLGDERTNEAEPAVVSSSQAGVLRTTLKPPQSIPLPTYSLTQIPVCVSNALPRKPTVCSTKLY